MAGGRVAAALAVAASSLAVIAVVGIVGALPAGATGSIDPPTMSNSSEWSLLSSDASLLSSALELTPNSTDQAGIAVYNSELDLSAPLTLSFDLTMTGGTGADGVTLDLFSAEPSAAGNEGGGLGLAGIDGTPDGTSPTSIGVAFDTHNDSCGDSGSNFVAVTDGETGAERSPECAMTSDLSYHQQKNGHLGSTTLNGISQPTGVEVKFSPGSSTGSIEVWLNGDSVLNASGLDVPVDEYLGFTGATGSEHQEQEISSFDSTAVATINNQANVTTGATGIATGDAAVYSATSTSGSSPVNTESGDFWHTFTDFSIPGYGPFLDLSRTYNSLDAVSPLAGLQEGIFGYGWNSTYDQRVIPASTLSPCTPDDASCLTIVADDGSELTLPPSGGCYTNSPLSDASLTCNEDGSFTYLEKQSQTTLTFNASGQLTSIEDENGDTTTLSYSSGQLHTVTDPAGRTLTFAFSGGLVSSVTDPMGREVQYGYDSGNLTSVTDPLLNVTSFGYDAEHLMTSMTLPNGQSGGPDAGDDLVNTYDTSTGRITSQTDPDGNETTYSYSASPDDYTTTGGTTTVTDPDGNVETDVYTQGLLQSQTKTNVAGSSSTWTYGYDPNTLAETSVTDPNNNTTMFSYDTSGNLLSKTNALGNTWTYAYNSSNEQTCASTPLAALPCSSGSLSPAIPGTITVGGSISTVSTPPAFMTYTAYDGDGNEIYQTSGAYEPPDYSSASTTRTTYNLYNGNSVTVDSDDDSCSTDAPSTSLPCETIDPNGVVTKLTYDTYGNVASKSTPDGNADDEVAKTTYSYDDDSEQTDTVSPDGNLAGANIANYTTHTTNNADGEKASVTVGYGDGLTVTPRTTTYSYDGDGNLTTTARTTTPHLDGTTSASSATTSLSLSLPTQSTPGDEAVVASTFPNVSSEINTIAGARTAATASDIGPKGVAVDSSGDVYTSDADFSRVVELAKSSGTQWGISMTAGHSYTIAGSSSGASGTSGDGGPATSALLDAPGGLAIDAAGDIYIADVANNRIQEIAKSSGTQWGISMTAGDIYTVAGNASGASGRSGDDGPATSAFLFDPLDVAVDSSGNLYIADTANSAVREVAASTGTQWGVSMTAGDIYAFTGRVADLGDYPGTSGDGGPVSSAGVSQPEGIAIDSAGDVYIADTNDNLVREVAASTGTQWGISMTAGDIYSLVGDDDFVTTGDSGDGGPASSALLAGPEALAFDSSGDLYILDGGNYRIQEIANSTGTQWGVSMTADDIYTVAGSASGASGDSGNGGPATSALFAQPDDLATDASGDLYIPDFLNYQFREVAASSGTQWGQSMTAGDIYLVGSSGTIPYAAGDGGAALAAGLTPSDVAIDSAGDIYIADTYNARVEEIPATTGTQWGISMTAGDIYTVAGSPDGLWGDSGDGGPATSARLSHPVGIAVDSAGDLYIVDNTNDQVQEVAASSGTQWGQSMTAGDIYTVAGSASGASGDSGDAGPATSALLSEPGVIAIDSAGDLYIVDSLNSRIQEVASSTGTQWGQSMTAGDIYTIAGSASGASGDSGDGGPATSALLLWPEGVTIDAAGDLYIADTDNNEVREVAASSGTQWGQSMTAGDIYTVAGSASGSSGDSGDNGSATSALLYWPSGLATDATGDLYIADAQNNRIQEVAASSGDQRGQWMTAGDVYTVAGSATGSSGYSGDGGSATAALLEGMGGIALDSSGDIYLTQLTGPADAWANSVVREVTPVAVSQSTPSGYVLARSESAGEMTTNVYTHEVLRGETGVTLDDSWPVPQVAVLAEYRGVNSATPVDVSGVGSNASGTSVSVGSITTADPADQLVFVGGGLQDSSATWTAPAGFATESSGSSLSGTTDFLADETGPDPAGATGSSSASVSPTGSLTGVLLALVLGVATTTTYDADDQPVVATDADGNSTLTCYDGDGNVTETVPPIGVAKNHLDASSCEQATLYPDGYASSGVENMPVSLALDSTLTTYDGLGDKLTVESPAPAGLSGHETTTDGYDAAGNLVSVTAPPTSTSGGAPNQVTDYSYDAANELLSTTTGVGTDTASTTTDCYDPDGNKSAVVAPDGYSDDLACSSSFPYNTGSGYETVYEYDSLGELVSETRPATTVDSDGMTTAYSYDPAGNQLTSEDANGVTTTDTYTPLNQLATESYSDATHEVTDTYDADGNRTQMTDASGTSSYTFDPFGELTSTENGASQTVSYTYDTLGDTTSITYPLGAGWVDDTGTVTYGYDDASQMLWLADFNDEGVFVKTNADGLPSSLELGSSGDTLSTSYDLTNSPSSIKLSDGSTLQEFAYSDAPSGAVVTETDTPSGSLTPEDYTYTAQGWVTSMTPGSGSTNDYIEDASGNLTELPTGESATYDDASELTSSTLAGYTKSYTYDADGERTEVAHGGPVLVTASYNGAEELDSYNDAAADTSSATYDGDGLRTASTTTPFGGSEASSSYVWDTRSSVPRLLMDSTYAYIYGPNSTPIEQVNLSSHVAQYLVADALGSVRGVVDASSGSLTASTSYDAWGNPETAGGLTSYTPFGFAGGYTDPTGLIYLINRYYDPSTGQFLTVDPDVAQTGQPYAYTGDDPVNETDANGTCVKGLGFLCKTVHVVAHAADVTRHTTAHVADNGVTEATSHWRGLAKIGIVTVTVVGGSACALATAGVCGAAAFSIGGVELSGGAIAVGLAGGAGEGAADYALDTGSHTGAGYASAAATSAATDSLLAGAPEELVFGEWAQGAHSAELTFGQALQDLPSFVSSLFK